MGMKIEPEHRLLLDDTQRALGHALLRFQHLEHALKVVVTARFVANAPGETAHALKVRRDLVAVSPLGWLKEEFLAKYVKPEGASDDERELDKAAAKGHIAFRTSVTIPAQEHAALAAQLSIVHERRNVVVHHFFEMHDLHTAESCTNALEFLAETHQLLDTHSEEVIRYVRRLCEAQVELGKYLLLPDVMNSFLQALAPTKKKRRKKPSGSKQVEKIAPQ